MEVRAQKEAASIPGSATGSQGQISQQQQSPHRIVQLLDYFLFRNHFCLVFELLDLSLYDLLKDVKFTGFSFTNITSWTKAILEAIVIAQSKSIIHCDLKPENIMLKK